MSDTTYTPGPEIVTPDGVKLGTQIVRREFDDYNFQTQEDERKVYTDTVVDPVKYEGWDIDWADYNDSMSPEGSWQVIGDIRSPGSGMAESNGDYTAAVLAAADQRGATAQADPEYSCSYFYTKTLKEAKAVVDAIHEVAPHTKLKG
jgi:hypothetical protein